MKLFFLILLIYSTAVFGQKNEPKTLVTLLKVTERIPINPATIILGDLRIDSSFRIMTKEQAISLFEFMKNRNKNPSLKLSNVCNNIFIFTNGIIIVYWDHDVGLFRETYLKGDNHLRSTEGCSQVYSIR